MEGCGFKSHLELGFFSKMQKLIMLTIIIIIIIIVIIIIFINIFQAIYKLKVLIHINI